MIFYLTMRKYIVCLCFWVLFLVSCENEPPYIKNPVYNIVVYENGSLAGASMSAFLSVHFVLYDENGFDDIAEVSLVNLDNDFVWRLDKDDLEKTIWGDDTYYGYSFFEYDNGRSVLLGNYAIRATDRAGNETDLALTVDIQGDTSRVYMPHIPDYEMKLKDNKKELEITGFDYSSVEVRFIANPERFNNSRKKFNKGEKLILSEKELIKGDQISVRLNSAVDERLIYFLKNFTVK